MRKREKSSEATILIESQVRIVGQMVWALFSITIFVNFYENLQNLLIFINFLIVY